MENIIMALFKIARIIAFIVGLSFACFVVGCASSGHEANLSGVSSTPEEAFHKLMEAWQKTDEFSLKFTSAGDVIATLTAGTEGIGIITFHDLAGAVWSLKVKEVKYLSNEKAQIYASYMYKDFSQGRLDITFEMIREQSSWSITDITVVSLPSVLAIEHGLQGFIQDEKTGKGLEGVLVYLSGTNFSAASDASGFYRLLQVPPGTYTVIFVKDGYVLKTITNVVVL